MEVILLKDQDNLGYRGDIVNVKPGYARNYLLPNRVAVVATPSSKKQIEEEQRQASRKLEQIKQAAEDLARKIEETSVPITVKVGTSGKIFGSVTTNQIAQTLKQEGFDIDRKKISLTEEIKSTGNFKAKIRLHKEVEADLTIEVKGEQTEIGTKKEE